MTADHAPARHRVVMTAYEIKVKGRVDPDLVAGLGRFETDTRPATTVLRGSLDDDGGLRKLLADLQGLGLELLEVREVDGEPPGA
jgi:hypothetical protein